MLLTRRDLRKHFGGLWECTGGSALAGEDSRTAGRRELREETGLDLGGAEPELLGTTVYVDEVVDTYAVRLPFALADVRPPRRGRESAPEGRAFSARRATLAGRNPGPRMRHGAK